MSCAAVFTQIQVPPVVFAFQTQCIHTSFQNIQSFFSLAAADDFAYAGNQQVHRSYCFLVIVQTHVECFDFYRVVCNEYGFFEDLFCQISFMFCLQVDTPFYGIFKLLTGFFQQFNCFCVCYSAEFVGQDVVQSFQQAFVYKVVEEFHFFGSMVQNILNDVFQHFFCDFHVVIQVSECHFGFDHPEFRSMSCCVGVFCTECGAECIDVTESHCKCFCGQLTGYCQVCFFTKEVFGVVDFAVFCSGQVFQIQSCYTEHFACTFTVRTCDDGCVCVNEAFVLEEFVDRHSNQGTNTECCGEQVCSGTQVSDFTQEFYRVTFFLQRVVGCGCTFYFDFCCFDFEGLFCFGCFHQQTFYDQGSAYVLFCDFFVVGNFVSFENYLNVFEERTVVQFDETEVFGCTHCTDPAADCYFFICILRCVAVDRLYCCQIHDVTPFLSVRFSILLL